MSLFLKKSFQICVSGSQVIAQTCPALICQRSSQRKLRERLNWLLRSPWEQRCRSRTSATSCTCVTRYVCFIHPQRWRACDSGDDDDYCLFSWNSSCRVLSHYLIWTVTLTRSYSKALLHLLLLIQSIIYLFPTGDWDYRVPQSAVRLPKEPNDGYCPQLDCHGGWAGRRSPHLTCR